MCALVNLEGTLPQLFLSCSFSLQFWQFLGISWDTSLGVKEMIVHARQLFGSTIFREISMVASCLLVRLAAQKLRNFLW
jgi:hypothetical protein